MTGKRIGYKRVSCKDQNPDRQLENIELDKIFVDYSSAKSTDRPELSRMLDFIREEDTLIVHSMDRLARNLFDLKKLVQELVKKNIKVHFVKENLIFSREESAMSNFILSLMGAFAEFEHSFIRERQREGIAIAKKQGKFLGGQKKLNKEKIEFLKKEIQTTRKSKSKIAQELGVSRATVYSYLKELNIFPPIHVTN